MKRRLQIVGGFEPESSFLTAVLGDGAAIQVWKGEHGAG